MVENTMNRSEQIEALRQKAHERMMVCDYEGALSLVDQALAICEDEETTERLTLSKAQALIGLEEDGQAVRALPAILMRRRNPRHAVLAASNLQWKRLRDNDLEASIRFGQIALEEVRKIDEPLWEMSILTDLASAEMRLSHFALAIRYERRALALTPHDDAVRRAVATENLGYSYVQIGQVQRGIRFIRKSLAVFDRPELEAWRCEALLDLCNAYLEAGEYDRARQAGRDCLAVATEPRQIRNCHYLLGEAAARRGNRLEAKRHFGVLAAFYPEFTHLPDLLLSFDISKVVNFKL